MLDEILIHCHCEFLRLKKMATSAVQLLVGNPLLPYKWNRIETGNKGACKVSHGKNRKHLSLKCSSDVVNAAAPTVERRSANYYTSCVWDYDYILSYTQNKFLVCLFCFYFVFCIFIINHLHEAFSWFRSFLQGEDVKMQIDEMKQQVLVMLGCVSDQAEQLELIDDLQRLGVAYHFEKEIKTILNGIYYNNYIFGQNFANGDLLSGSSENMDMLCLKVCSLRI